MDQRFSRRAAAVVSLLFVTSAAYGKIPATQGTRTKHDFVRALLDYNQRTLAEPYKQIGKHDPKWDALATQFLDGMALRFANSQAGYIYALPGIPRTEELAEMGASLRKMQCDDPMVQYCCAIMLMDTHHAEEAETLFKQSSAALMTSHYPVTRAAVGAQRLYQYAPDGPESDKAWETYKDVASAAWTVWDFKNLDRRIIFQHLIQGVRNEPKRFQDLADAIRNTKGADPWIMNMVNGECEIAAAWVVRGSGTADTVTKAGWQGFYAHLTKARDYLKAAWKAQPTYPEAATDMITVAMGAGEALNENERTWFERATSAQIDHTDAYVTYRYALLPRWSGSLEELRAFSKECLETKRFDTEVPWQGAITLETIISDSNSQDYWRQRGVYEDIQQMCDGYAKSLGSTEGANYFRSYHAAVAWRTNHFTDATQLLDNLGDHVKTEPFGRIRVMSKMAISHAYVSTGAQAKAVAAAETDAAAGFFDKAITAYSAAADASDVGKGQYFVKNRLQQLKWQKQFEAGETANIRPDAQFLAWTPTYGKWAINADGTISGRADDTGSILMFQGAFMGRGFEVEATFDFSQPQKEIPMGGIAVSLDDPTKQSGIWLFERGDQLFIKNDFLPGDEKSFPLIDQTSLKLGFWQDRIEVRVNGKHVYQITNMDRVYDLSRQRLYLSVGGGAKAGSEVKILSIRLRKLTEVPRID